MLRLGGWRFWVLVAGGLMFASLPAFSQRRGSPAVSTAQLRSQVTQILRPAGRGVPDALDRDGQEEALVALGSDVLPLLKTEFEQRTGSAKDAVAVAIFRLEHPALDIADSLRTWGVKHYALADAKKDPASLFKLTHIFDKDGIHAEMFPNHIFYIVEYPEAPAGKPNRVVAAMAIDGKVQALNDDATLTKFFAGEGEPKTTHEGKVMAARSALLLSTARVMTVPPEEPPQGRPVATGSTMATTFIERQGVKLSVNLTFDKDGKVTKVVTTQDGAMPAATTAAPAKPE